MKRNVILVIVLLALAGCDQKYEDGPCLSFVSEQRRLLGLWTMETVMINGLEKDTLPLEQYGFSINKNLEDIFFIHLFDINANDTLASDYLVIKDDFTILEFGLEVHPGAENRCEALINILPCLFVSGQWLITRLKQKEMYIHGIFTDIDYVIKFKLKTDYDIH